MDYIVDINELRENLDWMIKDGCDIVELKLCGGKDGQPPCVTLYGGSVSEPNVLRTHELLILPDAQIRR